MARFGRWKSNLRVHVDNHRCHRYGLCQAEAPEVFQLTSDGRLRYTRRPATETYERVRMAARDCPMQAIELEERGR